MIRYEKFDHLPNLETALAYEAIFKTPISELFGGLYQKVEAEVAERTKLLSEKKGRKSDGRLGRTSGLANGMTTTGETAVPFTMLVSFQRGIALSQTIRR